MYHNNLDNKTNNIYIIIYDSFMYKMLPISQEYLTHMASKSGPYFSYLKLGKPENLKKNPNFNLGIRKNQGGGA